MVLIKKTLFPVAVILSLAVLLLTGCGNTSSASAEQNQDIPPVVKIGVSDWGWDTSVITIKQGETVTLEIANTGRMPHGIFVPALGINEGVSSGEVIQVTINAQTAGKFVIRCNDPMCGTDEQHADMIATLLIIE